MNLDNKSLSKQGGKVLLLIDWENVFFCLFESFGPDRLDLHYRFEKLMEWIKNEIGDLLGSHGFIFAPEHFSSYHREICVKNGLRIMICPKKKSDQGNGKEEDTVDPTIISFGEMMLGHPEVGFICLVSGDEDYVPLLEKAQIAKIKIALVPPTINSLSVNKAIIKFIDTHPDTGKKMVLMLDQINAV